MSKRKLKSSTVSDDRTNMESFSGFDNLPKEIWPEILFRLQPKSLMSLKSLNKSWYFVIRCLTNNPDFIAKQQRHAEARSTIMFINEPPLLRHRRSLQSPAKIKHGLSKVVALDPGKKKPSSFLTSMFITQFVDNGDDNIQCVTENIYVSHLPGFLIRERDVTMKVYHCNGVICLTKDSKTLTIYNPMMGDFETFHPKLGGKVGEFEHRVCGIGFGSDPEATHFKVVRILGSRAQVFAPGTTNSWRKIDFAFLDRDYRTLRDHLYSRGYCFWLTNDSHSVLCFDVRSEVFHEIPLPNELDTSNPNEIDDFEESEFDIYSHESNLAACNDSVCLFWYVPKEFIDIWVVDIENEPGDGGFVYSWRKWLRIDRFQQFRSTLTFWRSDEILMKTRDRKIILFNVVTRRHKSLSINEMLGYRYLYFGHYVNSLASINWTMKHIRSNPSR